LPFQKVDAEGVLARLEFSILFGYALNIFLEDLVLVFLSRHQLGWLDSSKKKASLSWYRQPQFPLDDPP
jgi:hypothetical protein